MKKLLMPSSIKQIKETISLVDGYILSLKNFSVNAPFYFELDEIINILEKKEKEIFISINKNITESSLTKLETILNKLSKYDINGIMYADASIVEINNRLNKKFNLIWSNEHVTTNYNTINFMSQFNVKGVLVSPELTLREIKEIKENTNVKCFAYIFGYLPMFISFRHTIQNYYDFSNNGKQKGIHKIYKEEKYYPIIDNKNGSEAYSNFILNGLNEYKELSKINFEYGIFNSLLVDDDKLKQVLEIFDNGKKEEIDSLFSNTDTGFFYKETVYKVK